MADPTSVIADGSLKVTWVPAIADPAAPSAAVLNGASAIDLSLYLAADGYTTGGDEASVTDDRLGSRQTYERPGRHSDTLGLRYVYQAQGTPTDNKAFDTLKHLTTGFIVSRWAADFEDAYATGDKVDVMPVQLGKQMKEAPTANSVLKIMQKAFITGAMKRDVTVVA